MSQFNISQCLLPFQLKWESKTKKCNVLLTVQNTLTTVNESCIQIALPRSLKKFVSCFKNVPSLDVAIYVFSMHDSPTWPYITFSVDLCLAWVSFSINHAKRILIVECYNSPITSNLKWKTVSRHCQKEKLIPFLVHFRSRGTVNTQLSSYDIRHKCQN